jgi:hypothetical protein
MARQKGPFTILNRPPRINDPRSWERWTQDVYSILSGEPGIAWDVVDKEGSELSDIETRWHSMLQLVLQEDVSLKDTDLEKHINNELAYSWDRNQVYPVNVSAGYTAKIGEHISVTCSTGDINVILPSAVSNAGFPVWIHKTDATAFKVTTTVKDIKFQNTTMHLVSNGIDWVIS